MKRPIRFRLILLIFMLFFLFLLVQNLPEPYSVSAEDQWFNICRKNVQRNIERKTKEFNSIWEHWNSDPEFKNLPYSRKCSVLNNYFNEKIADIYFSALPGEEEAEKIKCIFILEYIGSPDPARPYGSRLEEWMCTKIKGHIMTNLHKLREEAEQGDADAQFRLGYSYYKGGDRGLSVRIAPDYKEAAKWIRMAAEQGHVEAQFQFGIMYDLIHYESPLTRSCVEAVRWYRKAAEQGHLDAQRRLGHIYSGHKLPFWLCPKGIEQDFKEAVKWYRKAAEQGHVGSQFYLGVMYSKGQGVPQDYGEAMRWTQKAAEQGEASAQYNLGLMYYRGEGVPQDYIRAYAWVNLAAANNSENAEFRDKVSDKMTTQQIALAQELSGKLQNKIEKKTATLPTSPPGGDKPQIKATGTGFLISRDGYVLTCHHVVEGVSLIYVGTAENTYPAKVVREDRYCHLRSETDPPLPENGPT